MTGRLIKAAAPVLAAALILGRVGRGTSADQIESAERAAKTAALQCYALEGAYPPDVGYLHEHYGLGRDPDVILYYEYIASNLMPQITAAKR